MNKTNFIAIAGILLFFTGCVSKSQDSILGSWESPTDEGGYLEFKENGILTSHMKFEPDLAGMKLPEGKNEFKFQDMEIPGTWKIFNESDIELTFKFSNETITVTNTIVQILDDILVMNINGTNSTYSRIQ